MKKIRYKIPIQNAILIRGTDLLESMGIDQSDQYVYVTKSSECDATGLYFTVLLGDIKLSILSESMLVRNGMDANDFPLCESIQDIYDIVGIPFFYGEEIYLVKKHQHYIEIGCMIVPISLLKKAFANLENYTAPKVEIAENVSIEISSPTKIQYDALIAMLKSIGDVRYAKFIQPMHNIEISTKKGKIYVLETECDDEDCNDFDLQRILDDLVFEQELLLAEYSFRGKLYSLFFDEDNDISVHVDGEFVKTVYKENIEFFRQFI